MPAATETPKKNTQKYLAVLVLLTVVVGLLIGVILIKQQKPQDIREQAAPLKTGPLCPANGANCAWSALPEASSYSYEIRDIDTGDIIKSGITEDTKITFTPLVNHTYRCSVKAINVCGEGPTQDTEKTCIAVPPTETPTLKISPTPTKILTLTPTKKPSPTPTKGPSPTPTNPPTGGPTPTKATTPSPSMPPGTPSPTPPPAGGPTTTPTPNPSATPLPAPSATPNPSIIPSPTEIILVKSTNTPGPNTPRPTSSTAIPKAGVVTPTAIIFAVSVLVILFGLVL